MALRSFENVARYCEEAAKALELALRPRQAAWALGISPRLLWQLTHDGVIPCVRIGVGKRRVVLYSVTALENWLRQQSEATKGG